MLSRATLRIGQGDGLMMTQCTPIQFKFQGLGRRKVQAAFDGGHISSDGGPLLPRDLDGRFGIMRRLAECLTHIGREGCVPVIVARDRAD